MVSLLYYKEVDPNASASGGSNTGSIANINNGPASEDASADSNDNSGFPGTPVDEAGDDTGNEASEQSQSQDSDNEQSEPQESGESGGGDNRNDAARLLADLQSGFVGRFSGANPDATGAVNEFSIERIEVDGELAGTELREKDSELETATTERTDIEEAGVERLRSLFSSSDNGEGLLSGSGFVDGIDQLRDEYEDEVRLQEIVIGSGFAVSGGISLAYVLMLARSGVLLSSVLSTLPAWRLVDPFPILSNFGQTPGDEDSESLQSIAESSNGDKEQSEAAEDADNKEPPHA